MIDKLQNYDTVITTNNIKKIILKTLSQEKKLLNLKFYTLEEFKNNYNNYNYYFQQNHLQ